jgi:hypothetical protein
MKRVLILQSATAEGQKNREDGKIWAEDSGCAGWGMWYAEDGNFSELWERRTVRGGPQPESPTTRFSDLSGMMKKCASKVT